MSKDKRQQRDEALKRKALDGAREIMESPNGRAFMWMLYADNADAEGSQAKGRRAVARDLLRSLKLAHWPGVQAMREEWEQPNIGPQEEPEGDGDYTSA